MAWDPNATVTIGGVDLTGNTLNGVRISYGRPSIWDQARASYATIDILNVNNTDFGFEINDSVVIKVQDSSAIDVTVFTGVVTEISNQIAVSGSNATVAIQTITAVGPFAQMSRTIVGNSNWPQEYDDNRLTRIFTDAGVSVDVVDSPGVYEFTSRSKNPKDAYTLAASYASQAFGYIYETKTGTVGYANESRRTVDVDLNGYLDIDEGYINWRGINSRKSISDILNRVILFYKNNAEVTSDDAHSISQYGLYEGTITTELENMDEAQNVADRFVSLRSIPETNFSSFNINLDNPNITAGDLDDLININMGTAIQIDNLPNPISPITYKGFVEGWSLVIDRSQALLTIISSDSVYSVVPIRWQDVDPTTEWDDLDPTAVKTTRTNLILNPSFEVNTTGWIGFNANYTLTQYTSDSEYGTSSLRVNISAATGLAGAITSRNATYRVAVANGQTWTVQAWYKNLIGTRNMRVAIATFATATGTTAVETFTGSNLTNPTSWTQSSLTATFTNANSLFMEIRLFHSSTGSINDAYLVDGVIAVQESSNSFYWDGSITDIPTSRRPEIAWTGTANLSTSTAEAYFGTIPTLTWANVDTVGLP